MPCLVITWAQLLTFSKSVKVLRHIFGVFSNLWRRDALSAISKFAFPVFSYVLLASRSLCSLNSPFFYFILNNIAVRLGLSNSNRTGDSPIVCVILIHSLHLSINISVLSPWYMLFPTDGCHLLFICHFQLNLFFSEICFALSSLVLCQPPGSSIFRVLGKSGLHVNGNLMHICIIRFTCVNM